MIKKITYFFLIIVLIVGSVNLGIETNKILNSWVSSNNKINLENQEKNMSIKSEDYIIIIDKNMDKILRTMYKMYNVEFAVCLHTIQVDEDIIFIDEIDSNENIRFNETSVTHWSCKPGFIDIHNHPHIDLGCRPSDIDRDASDNEIDGIICGNEYVFYSNDKIYEYIII
ncbi:MAG TPA: hypothetical protein VJN02_12895 [Gammaproteobacteria bacterium]|nr:hypothetical protein [Gammaproteobacteria bacterium]